MAFIGFLGTFTPRMDDKGRVTLPAKYREVFSGGAVVLQGKDRCVFLFTPEGFLEYSADAMDAPVSDRPSRANQRMMFGRADQQQPDSQGRLVLPARLREYAELDKDVVIVGVGKRMEIWDAARWAEYEAAQEEAYADMAEDD